MVNTMAHVQAQATSTLTARADAIANARVRLATGQPPAASPGGDATTQRINAAQLARMASYREAMRGTAQTASALEVADTALARIGNLLRQQQDLARLAADTRNTPAERALLDMQFKALSSEIDRIAQQTRFGSQRLLDGNFKVTMDTTDTPRDAAVTIAASDSASLYANRSTSIADPNRAADTLGLLTNALDRVRSTRTDIAFGRQQSSDVQVGLARAMAGLSGTANGQPANGRTAEILRLTIETITQQTGIAVLAQAQQLNSDLLALMLAPHVPPPSSNDDETPAVTTKAATLAKAAPRVSTAA